MTIGRQAKLRFFVNGKEVLSVSPAKFLECYLVPTTKLDDPIQLFSLGSEITCHLEINGNGYSTTETVRDLGKMSMRTVEQEADALFKRLMKGKKK